MTEFERRILEVLEDMSRKMDQQDKINIAELRFEELRMICMQRCMKLEKRIEEIEDSI